MKFFPIRVFSIWFGFGWWLGKYFFFFGKHATAFAIIPMCFHHNRCTYEHGKGIEGGNLYSWSDERQREKQEDNGRRCEGI